MQVINNNPYILYDMIQEFRNELLNNNSNYGNDNYNLIHFCEYIMDIDNDNNNNNKIKNKINYQNERTLQKVIHNGNSIIINHFNLTQHQIQLLYDLYMTYIINYV